MKARTFALIIGIAVAVTFPPTVAQAGTLDAGGQKPKQGGGSLSSALGATDVSGWKDFAGCMGQTSGHHEKLTADVLERKLADSSKVSEQQRREIQEDIQWLRATAGGARNLPQPDPKNPRRWLLVLTDEEQVGINRAASQFANETREKCDAEFGGVAQFADPAGRRPARPPRAADTGTPAASGTTVPAKPSAAGRREQADKCFAQAFGLRWKIMADHLEKKLAVATTLPPAERAAWEEDISALRKAADSGALTIPSGPDQKNPMRYMTRLTADEHQAVTREYEAGRGALMATCSPAK